MIKQKVKPWITSHLKRKNSLFFKLIPFSKTNKQKKTTNFIISLKQDKLKNALGLLKLRNLYISEVEKRIPYVRLNGHRTKRLPGNANFSFEFESVG